MRISDWSSDVCSSDLETWCRRSESRPRLPLKPRASGKAPNQRRQPVAPAAAAERRVVLAAEHAHAIAERLFPKILRGQACQFGADRRNLLGVLAVEECRHHGIGCVMLDAPVLVEEIGRAH